MLRMLFMGVMVMTTMDTACVLSFQEEEGEVAEAAARVGAEEEEVAAVVVGGGVGVVVEAWDPRGEGTAPRPDALSTGLLCQVSVVFLSL